MERKRDKKRFWPYAALAVVGMLALCLGLEAGSARADPPQRTSWPSEVQLPAGRKLVNVSWLCYQACEPWVVTRPMRAGEAAESYTFTNGRETVVYREAAASR